MPTPALHESADDLAAETREMHRALVSLIEELEAVDWYGQRMEASGDAALRQILRHNHDEEIEHACMTLEWIRRRDTVFDEQLRRQLFRSPDDGDSRARGDGRDPTLGIGSLREAETPS